VYQSIFANGEKYDVIDAGYRALSSLSLESGFHHWGHSVRPDDTPQEANLLFCCEVNTERDYVGKQAVEEMMKTKPKKIGLFFSADRHKSPLFGHEVIRRNGVVVGMTRMAEYGFACDKEVVFGYVDVEDDASDDFTELLSGDFTIENQGIEYSVECSLKSIFDPEHGRLFGRYSSYDTDLISLQKTIYDDNSSGRLGTEVLSGSVL